MSLLRSLLPPPFGDLLLILLVALAAWLVLPFVARKLRETGVWDSLADKVGGEKLRQMQLERQIARLTKQGDHLAVAQLYEDAEWYPDAIDAYVEIEEYAAAGAIYEKLEQWEQAADMYLQVNDWKRAANIYAKRGKQAKAAEVYEQHGQKIDAAKLHFEAGRYDRAAKLYEVVSYFPQAGKAFEKMGDFLRAAENYEKHWAATTSVGGTGLIASPSERESRVARHAGQLYEKAGALEKAAAIYKRAGLAQPAAALAARMGRFEEAGEMLLKEEKLEEAADMFDKAGKQRRASLLRGEMAFHKGDNAGAAEEFLKGGDNMRAAELFEGVGDLVAAARCYVESDSPLQAANVYLRAEKKEEAAAMFEKGRDFETAARLYSELGQGAKASALYEQAGRFYDAGRLAHSLADGERAIRLLQQIDPSDENYESATLILSRLFIEKNMASLAIEKLFRVLADRPISPQTLEHFYNLGLAYEKLGKTREAMETFRKVMAERYGYRDVESRVARLSGAAAAPAAPQPQPPRQAQQAPEAREGLRQRTAEAPRAPRTPVATPSKPLVRPSSSPFRVTEELGRGLLGTTFKGIDTRNGRPVTVKFLRKDLLGDRAVVQQFLTEARLAQSLEHPSLVRLLGLTEIKGEKAAIMEYVDGFDLGKFLSRNKRLSVKQAVDVLTTLCMALGHAHERKLLHRDLKLTNVLIARGGKLRLAGFGLGALRTPGLGKADGYPSPEFLSGGSLDERSDIFSMGGLVLHTLSGVDPGSQELAFNGALPSLRQLVPNIPEGLAQILSCCLAEEPGARFHTMSEVLAAAGPLRG